MSRACNASTQVVEIVCAAPHMTKDDERRYKCRSLKVVVDESIPVEPPNLLRVLLYFPERKAATNRVQLECDSEYIEIQFAYNCKIKQRFF